MVPAYRIALLATVSALLASAPPTIAVAGGGARLRRAAAAHSGDGGAPLSGGGLDPRPGSTHGKVPPPPSRRAHGRWLRGVTVTEYWPAPESWFVGRLVKAPGLPGRHRIDWLYSATGLSMQGDGIGLNGRRYHIAALGIGGWVTAAGGSTSGSDGWMGGAPFWRAGGYWRNRHHGVTFPLAQGGWSSGHGRRYVPLPGVRFAAGSSLPLRFYQSIAVDPSVIPLGSRVYVPGYRHDGHGGWFVARDTGGAISGRHNDVYRPPPASSSDLGQLRLAQRIYVIRPRA